MDCRHRIYKIHLLPPIPSNDTKYKTYRSQSAPCAVRSLIIFDENQEPPKKDTKGILLLSHFII